MTLGKIEGNKTLIFGLLLSFIVMLSYSPSFAQLNQNCTVSVLNRTAQVKADGSWVIPNVPSNMGMVRVRATCVENGVTRSGQSDWVSVPTNGTIKVGDIPLDVFEPSPAIVSITSPTTILTAIGNTAQLTVTATYPGGLTRDITQGTTGTVYRTTNPALATVSENGMVTATGTGRVIISVSNDMVLSSLLFTVTQTDNPDADGDGIPDAWEIANGLNPNDPIDALEDIDGDGLSNKGEYDIGTDIRNPDTDGDGIKDEEETIAGRDGFITNPLLADSDGDGIKDGLEVQTGSDPTNAGSYNLSRALARLEVTPSNFVIVFNTIMTEASRQLTVTGVLTDGTRLDLTSNTRGTNYNSSDLAVANFGSTDGLVFAGQNGVAVITASNGGFNAIARVTIRTFSPTALSYVDIPGFANNVDVLGNYAYVAAGSTGLQVVDISNPSSPYILSSLDTPGNANDIKVAGNYAYIADGQSGLRIIDISNPLVPLFTGTVDTPGTAWDVAISENYAYIADGSAGLSIIDISNPLNPVIIGSIDTPGTAKGVDISGNYAVIADSSSVKIINISTPNNPLIVGTAGITGDAMDVIADGNTAYIASYTGGLRTIDFTNPANPVTTSTVGDNYLFDITKFGNFAFGADVFRVNASPIYNLSNPLSPVFTAILDFSRFSDYDGTGIAAANNYLYLTAAKGIIENGTTGSTRLFIGQYAEIVDTGTVPPAVNITFPLNGAEVIEGSTLPIAVSATDDVAVASVNVLVDGAVVSTDSSSPYQFNYHVHVGITSLAVGATAIDLNNNIGTAQNVFITVIPSPPPAVSITNPVSGATVIEGSIINIAIDASDDASVATVEFIVNGSVFATDTTAPYQIPYLVPDGISSLTIGARATDNIGKVGTANDITVNVIPDPMTTVIGRVVDINNQPIAGATVTILTDWTVITGPDGAFSITGVPTTKGNIIVIATAIVNGVMLRGNSIYYTPVLSGTIDVGRIILLQFSIALPKTGQTACYDSAGNVILCAGTGQDGDVQAGVAWPDTRFVVTYCDANAPCADQSSDCDGNASTDVVMDNLTGLIWTRNGVPTGTTLYWNAAIDYSNDLNLCGYSDWHLPNIIELESLVNYNEANRSSWLNTQGFYNVQSAYYWSSTTVGRLDTTDLAWRVNLDIGTGDHWKALTPSLAWPVRLGQLNGIISLPKTGQKTSYRTGDDGDLERGIACNPSVRRGNPVVG